VRERGDGEKKIETAQHGKRKRKAGISARVTEEG